MMPRIVILAVVLLAGATFMLKGDEMIESSREDQGRLSLADIDGDWLLVEFSPDVELPQDIGITLRMEGVGIGGKAACNRYSGSINEGKGPGSISIGRQMALTRMMCPPPLMEMEQAYLAALQAVDSFSFQAGRLLLSWREESKSGLLLFERASAVFSNETPGYGG